MTLSPTAHRDPAVSTEVAAEDGPACCAPQPGVPGLASEDAVELAIQLKALADPNRLTLLSLIAADARGEACVCDLTDPLGLGQPTVSHHLKILVDAGLLTREKRGVWSYYAVVAERLQEITHAVGHRIVPPAAPAATAPAPAREMETP
ncbi:metalloregulator ArsR/SmtB family transcription factor [Nesterenkonia sp. HG001]|uniref:ArsR/SmtB family transcription factor n=1 Tax=Nesterenkonia sp. HG001 TaxID=2983207 RepID=UPI002AC5B8E0|nr:metalloregulator ArsR/SmtB family transcription factor [Nesterenkonia sp. HG001]MDZ5078177.1 metalloregulator ArsR/SmtB family transcription factor [Nesterenkonia sp. HG001]